MSKTQITPTPPAEQQAAPKAAPSGPDYSEKWDAELGRTAMRFVDRAGDVHPGIDGAETICAEFHKAMLEVIERMPHVQRMAAPQQEAQEPCQTCIAMARTVMMDQVSFDRKPDCYGIRQITNDEGVEEWEDIRTSPDVAREEANDMMATGRGEIYEVVPLWTTPQPAPAPLSEMPYEKRKAIQEGEQIGASDAWFKARHEMLDTVDRRNVFRAGFDRGWNAAIAAQGDA